MQCVIRKLKMKTSSQGTSKRIMAFTSKFEDEPTRNCFSFSTERFERPPRFAYQILLIYSVRDMNGHRQAQWKAATIDYYDLVDEDLSWDGFVDENELEKFLFETDLTMAQWRKLIEDRLLPLQQSLLKDWSRTEEFKTIQDIQKTLKQHEQAKSEFEEKWGLDTYDFIYDVFGTLKNQNFLQWVQSGRHRKKNPGWQKNGPQPNGGRRKNPRPPAAPSFSDAEKIWLKKFYRTLAKEYHPDRQGDEEAMILINKLKSDWNL